ncbi:MAG TPA: hypothetical protein VHG71_06575 [Verrucomicrobiae bacterium]|nr:hypothetical protein [Verrucomicrobiae bacterium]
MDIQEYQNQMNQILQNYQTEENKAVTIETLASIIGIIITWWIIFKFLKAIENISEEIKLQRNAFEKANNLPKTERQQNAGRLKSLFLTYQKKSKNEHAKTKHLTTKPPTQQEQDQKGNQKQQDEKVEYAQHGSSNDAKYQPKFQS